MKKTDSSIVEGCRYNPGGATDATEDPFIKMMLCERACEERQSLATRQRVLSERNIKRNTRKRTKSKSARKARRLCR